MGEIHHEAEKPGEPQHVAGEPAIRAAVIRVAPSGSNDEDTSLPSSGVVGTTLATYADDLRDGPRSRAGNVTRARRIWAASGLDEAGFLRLLARAHDRALRAATAGEGAAHAGSRMPYFFAVLEDLADAARGDELARIWRQTLRALRASLRPDVVRRWLAGARLVAADRTEDDGVVATLVIPDPVGREKLGAEYRHVLERALASAFGEPARATILGGP